MKLCMTMKMAWPKSLSISTDEVKIPLEKNHVRITVMNGFFQMEYLGRNKTKFIYKLKVDPAGNIPKRVAYSVMKYYPFNSIKKLKKIVADRKYARYGKRFGRGKTDQYPFHPVRHP